MDIDVFETVRPLIHTLLLITLLYTLSGCSGHDAAPPQEPFKVPEITEAYLIEHRIVSHLPKYHETVVSTLPYEIKTFDESYLLRLIAQLPDPQDGRLSKEKKARYYLWLERRAKNWMDFTAVYSVPFASLTLEPHFSSIRQGHFYKEYTIDFSLEQLSAVQDDGLELLLVNLQNQRSAISLPPLYLKAFLQIVEETAQ